MTVEALLPVIAQHDDEVLNLGDDEVFDFLGDMGFQSVDNNAILAPVLAASPPSFPFSSIHTTSATLAVSATPGQAVSPAASVSGQESGDESSVSHVPAVVTTSSDIQTAHVKNQKAATSIVTKTYKTNVSTEDAALQKKNRRRERNREHAKRCRSRKKDYLKSLETSVIDLKQENDKLRRIMMMKFSREEITSLMNASPAAANAMMIPKPDVAPSSAATDYLQALRDGCGEATL
jgi:hypothetical protein